MLSFMWTRPLRPGRGGSAAVVCRDAEGNYLGSTALVVQGVDDPMILEAIACREALCAAEDLLLQSFVVASDAKQVVRDIAEGSHGKHGAIVHEIKARSTAFSCSFIFESRYSNVEAHRLARYALNLAPGRHVWFGQPHDVSIIPLSVEFDQ